MANEVDLRLMKDNNEKTVLHLAAAKGHIEICKLLVEEWGLDVNSVTTEGLNLAPRSLEALVVFLFIF